MFTTWKWVEGNDSYSELSGVSKKWFRGKPISSPTLFANSATPFLLSPHTLRSSIRRDDQKTTSILRKDIASFTIVDNQGNHEIIRASSEYQRCCRTTSGLPQSWQSPKLEGSSPTTETMWLCNWGERQENQWLRNVDDWILRATRTLGEWTTTNSHQLRDFFKILRPSSTSGMRAILQRYTAMQPSRAETLLTSTQAKQLSVLRKNAQIITEWVG